MASRVLEVRAAVSATDASNDPAQPPSGADNPILEIGPGLGALTWPLLQAGATVAAVEIDPAMGRLLATLAQSPDLNAIAGRDEPGALWLHLADARDVLDQFKIGPVDFGVSPLPVHRLDPAAVQIVCGNLPYYITTDLLIACMSLPAVRAGFFLTQLEFADRIVATDARSSLNVYLRNFGEWRTTLRLKGSAFYPRPRVESAFVEFQARPDGPRSDGAILQKVLRMSFGARRKKLSNSWKQDRRGLLDFDRLMAAAKTAQIDPDLRAEALPVDAYFRLANVLSSD